MDVHICVYVLCLQVYMYAHVCAVFILLITVPFTDQPVHKNETIEVLSTTSDSVKVTWEKLTSISANMSQFYGYVAVPKAVNTTNYTEFVSRRHDTSSDVFVVEIGNLNFNTKYDIQVWPYREMNGERDLGSSYQTLHVKTTCKG